MAKKYKIDLTYAISVRRPVSYCKPISEVPVKSRRWKLGITFKIFGRKISI